MPYQFHGMDVKAEEQKQASSQASSRWMLSGKADGLVDGIPGARMSDESQVAQDPRL